MPSYHIHISGLVQGIGFRPLVYQLACERQLNGEVNNSADGLHIYLTAPAAEAENFFQLIQQHPPSHARITAAVMREIPFQSFQGFHITGSTSHKEPDLLITPDLALCVTCRAELNDNSNRRHQYPFITCTHCGPRYSILSALPYDRELTSMDDFTPCLHCKTEYHDPWNRRYYSQTNSCSECGVRLFLFSYDEKRMMQETDIMPAVFTALSAGKIIAVKGIGGYLLLCDATDPAVVGRLRMRKQRPSRPFAVLYPDIGMAHGDVVIREEEEAMLTGAVSPVVLCRWRSAQASGIAREQVAPGLNRLGVMLPYAPLLAVLAQGFGKPLIATSANLSGSPILYRDEQAIERLDGIADLVLGHDRAILLPQDDSVVQFTHETRQPVWLRRGRGLAPYGDLPFCKAAGRHPVIAAMGADLKSSFAIWYRQHIYASAFLGDQSGYDAQEMYQCSWEHLTGLLSIQPEIILADSHPGYAVTQLGKEWSERWQLPFETIQHHKAHLAAVMAEHDLSGSDSPLLGVVWDGTGYGEDAQIWGSEFFLVNEHMERYCHLDYFPVLAGDKMMREPRLSALSLLYDNEAAFPLLRSKFSDQEWNYYRQSALQPAVLQTCSMGRFLDAMACLLGLADKMSYEGEAAMRLEALATHCRYQPEEYYAFGKRGPQLLWHSFLEGVISDLLTDVPRSYIACKIHRSLIELVRAVALEAGVTRIAFSGGVMQNALLADMIYKHLHEFEIYMHRQLPPNDECIASGQIAYYQFIHSELKPDQEKYEYTFK